ncbi:hypothetical protein [uncultured Sulfitobacter sp.]|uniref:hypothetical protein n=1 Tax=uncultured Sulfitobacter sp. TaxID=191468 RepID=UPI0026313816|nr:hypothetical protein [uncultured Sulfitobacter sp.]
MSAVLTGTPIWVWPLFILLVILGLRARHERLVPIIMFYALPLLGLSALNAVVGLSAGPPIWVVFALSYGAGIYGGYLIQRGWVLGREGRRVRLAGESLTLTMLMLVFGANFVGGFLEAVAPQVYGSNGFQIIFAAVVALSSGSFAGRALRVWKEA